MSYAVTLSPRNRHILSLGLPERTDRAKCKIVCIPAARAAISETLEGMHPLDTYPAERCGAR